MLLQGSMTEGFDGKRHTHWQRYSSLSMIAYNLRSKWPNYIKSTEDPVVFWQRSLQGVPVDAAVVGRACVLAQAEARQDVEAECAMSVCMVPSTWSCKIHEDFDSRTGCCPIAEWLDNSADDALRGVWVGTDGAGQGEALTVGAGVAFKRMDDERWESAGTTVKRMSIRLSREYGTKVLTVRDAELRAVLVGMAKVPDAQNPLVMDAQTEWKKLQKMEQWSARRLCQGSNIPIDNRLWRLLGQRCWAGLCDEQKVVDSWQHESVKASSVTVGGRTIVWVRSHQKEECVPNPFVVSLNEQADACAGAAVACGALPSVRLPAGLPRFYYTCDGKAVVTNIGKFLRNYGSVSAFALWKQRARHGVIPRVMPGLCRGILPLRQYAVLDIPQEVERIWWGAKDVAVNLEGLVWKLRHYIGGSYTQMLHRDTLLEDRIREHEGVLAYEIRVCRVCGGGDAKEEGTFRHLIMSCAEPSLTYLREQMWDTVECLLRGAVEHNESPCSHTQVLCHCVGAWMKRGCGKRPGGWSVSEIHAKRWPVLTYVGWLVPVSTEGRCVANPLAETAHDLAYRGLIPDSIARNLYREGLLATSDEAKQAIRDNSIKLVVVLSVYVGTFRRKVVEHIRRQYPKPAQAECVVSSVAEEETKEVPRCRGSGCAKRNADTGMLANIAVIRNRCRSCRDAELREEVVCAVREMLRVKQRKLMFVEKVACLEDFKAEYIRYRGKQQTSTINLCHGLRMNGVRHLHDDSRVCEPVSWRDIKVRCSCEDPVECAGCEFICALCANFKSGRTLTLLLQCAVCSKDGGRSCSGCGRAYHGNCLHPSQQGNAAWLWICPICYQQFVYHRLVITSSEQWAADRRRKHMENQHLLAQQAIKYGAVPS